MKTSLKLRTLITIGVIYAAFLWFAITSSWLVLVYAAAMIVVAAVAMSREEALTASGRPEFRKNYPLRRWGVGVAEFQHVFFHATDVTGEIVRELDGSLRARSTAAETTPVQLTDVDRELKQADTRTFRLASAPATLRGTTVSLAVYTSTQGELQTFRWWILLDGFRDPNKVAIFLALAPVTVPFWIVRFLRREHDIAPQLRNIYAAFYNDLDAAFAIRALYMTAFDALTSVLERNGIDISDLKANRAQILNINVSGGRATIGNVIQGVANKVREVGRPKAAA